MFDSVFSIVNVVVGGPEIDLQRRIVRITVVTTPPPAVLISVGSRYQSRRMHHLQFF